MTPLQDDDIIALIRAGIAAPSADNRHIVRFERFACALRLHVDRGAIVGAPAYRIGFHELAFGAIIENIALAAQDIGYAATVRQYPNWRDELVIADITFTANASHAEPDALRTAIFARTTNRRLYRRRRRASRQALDELSNAVGCDGSLQIRWLDDDRTRARALRMLFAAERERFRYPQMHAELFDAIRFDVGWQATTDEGLPPGTLEVESPLRSMFHALRKWPFQRAVNAIGAAHMLGVRAAWLPAWTAPHLALLSVPRGAGDLIRAGRAFQRFWLSATLHGIALQPLAACIAIGCQAPDEMGLPASISSLIREALEEFSGGGKAVMVARLGYADPPSVRTSRPSAATYLMDSISRNAHRA
jgi:hypothetical protein